MKKFLITLLAIGVFIYSCTKLQKTTYSSQAPIENCFCADSLKADSLCPVLPIDVNETFGFGYVAALTPEIQPAFDVFSWQTFIALNWPSDTAGNPLPGSLGEHPRAARVWESYTDPSQLFSASVQSEVQSGLKSARQSGHKFLYMDSKSPHPLDSLSGFQEADGFPLIDRNLNFVAYEVRVNPDETEFILENGLTTISGIDSFYNANNDQFSLPSSKPPATEGSMEVKAAWRILDTAKGDDPGRYYTRQAVIFVPAQNSVSGKAFSIQATVGLVGMHIIRKTQTFAKMTWSTFEHVDNTPDSPQEAQDRSAGSDSLHRWSFYNPACLNCPQNHPPRHLPGDSGQYKWDDQPPYAARYAVEVPGEANNAKFGSQIVRTYPIYYRTQQLNSLWQEKLKGTVWENYRLIGTQWTLGSEGFVPPNAPALLGNTTLESFMQEDASCISCHSGASIVAGPDTIFTDMSFIFGMAQ